MDELTKYILTFVVGVVFNAGLLFVALRNSRLGDSKSMSELQDVAKKAIEAQSVAVEARDQAIKALEEYKAMRVADFEIVIVFSLHPTPQIKDVAIRSLPESKKKTAVDDTKPLFKKRREQT